MANFHQTLAVLLFAVIRLARSDHYLVVFANVPGSHMMILAAAAEAMLERNHSVTILTPATKVADDIKGQLSRRGNHGNNYIMETHNISWPDNPDDHKKYMQLVLYGSKYEIFKFVTTTFPPMLKSNCEDVLQDTVLLSRLQAQHYDMVLVHGAFACSVLIAQQLDVKYATIFSTILPSSFNRLLGNSVNPAYNPELFTGYSDRMTFPERVTNTLISGVFWMLSDLTMRNLDEIKVAYRIKPDISTFRSLGDAEVFFVNSDFVLDFARPYQPNVVSVGGLTANPPSRLPQVGKYQGRLVLFM